MLQYAVVFFVIALIAALLGFGGIAAGAAEIAKISAVVRGLACHRPDAPWLNLEPVAQVATITRNASKRSRVADKAVMSAFS